MSVCAHGRQWRVSNVPSLYCLVFTPSSSLSLAPSPLTLLSSCDYNLTTRSAPSHHLISDNVFCHACHCHCVTGLRLIRILIFKILIDDFWQAVTTLINENHLRWCVCVKAYIFMWQVGRGLCNHEVNVLPAQWVLQCNYMSTQRWNRSWSRQPIVVIVKSFCEAMITCCPRNSFISHRLSGDYTSDPCAQLFNNWCPINK